MFFSNASIVSEDTHRSTLRNRVKAQTKCRQLHVNTSTVPETKNAGTQSRPVAGFRHSESIIRNTKTSVVGSGVKIVAKLQKLERHLMAMHR